MAARLDYVSDGTEFPLEQTTIDYLARFHILPPYDWDVEHREPYPWELEARPPMPFEAAEYGLVQRAEPTLALATTTVLSTEQGEQTDAVTNLAPAITGFYSVEPMVRGAILLTNNTTLSNIVAIDIASFAGGTNALTSIELLDVFQGKTNLIGCISATNITNARFMVDTAFLQTGEHDLLLRLLDNNGTADNLIDANEGFSEPVHVRMENPIFFYDYKAPQVGWKLVLKFGTPETNGTWNIDVYDEQSNVWATASGNLATTTREPDGGIMVEDAYIENGYGGYRYRNYYDEYPNEFLDVAYKVTPAADPTHPKIKNTRNRVKKLPPSRTYCVAEDPKVLNRPGGNRQVMDALMDVVLMSMAPLGDHFKLQNMSRDPNPYPQSEAWNKLSVTQNWFRLNQFIAGFTNASYPVKSRGTHLYTITHGDAGSIGDPSLIHGPGYEVTEATLAALGYWKQTNISGVITGPPPYSGPISITIPYSEGFRFVFLDSCESIKGALVATLLDSSGGSGGDSKVTLNDINQYGLTPHYGCGWTRKKSIGVLTSSDIDMDHAEYVSLYFETVMHLNQNGWPDNTYQDARNRAKKRRDGTTPNPAAAWYDYAGCDALFIDE